MTVANQTSRSDYTANGVLTTFAYTFKIFDSSHVKVYDAGVLKTLNVDYTVSNVGVDGGGNITFTYTPANGNTIAFLRNQPYTQLTDYVEGDPFPAETHEAALDRGVMLSQQLLEKLQRAAVLPDSSSLTSITLPVSVTGGELIRWKTDKTGLELIQSSSLAPGVLNPIVAQGDLVQGGSGAIPERLAIGVAGQVPGVASGKVAWVGGPDSIPNVRNLAGSSFAPLTSTIVLTADYVWLRDPTAKTTLLRTGLNATLNISTAGPAVNARDQAGTFGTNVWVYVYAIWNGTTLGTIASITAPPTGPTLPGGYTHWAFLTVLRVGGVANQWLAGGVVCGSHVMHGAANAALSGGTATVETTISLSSLIPPQATSPRWYGIATALFQDTAANVTRFVSWRLFSGFNSYFASVVVTQVANQNFRTDSHVMFPNIGQNLIYLWDAATGTRSAALSVTGYQVANGDS